MRRTPPFDGRPKKSARTRRPRSALCGADGQGASFDSLIGQALEKSVFLAYSVFPSPSAREMTDVPPTPNRVPSDMKIMNSGDAKETASRMQNAAGKVLFVTPEIFCCVIVIYPVADTGNLVYYIESSR